MVALRMFFVLCLASSFLDVVQAASAQGEAHPLIVRGKVTMRDGSAPPQPVGIQRTCDDIQGSAPGPLTNKKGEFVWSMDVDPMRVRKCRLEATLQGYVSSAIDISNLNAYLSTTTDLPPIVLSPKIPDPRTINTADADVPSKSKAAWRVAAKAIDTGDLAQAAKQFQAAAEASPKFARAWHALGAVYEAQDMLDEARAAYRKAIDADSKSVASYVTLSRLLLKAKDWEGASKTAEALMKFDPRQPYREIYLHHAVARYRLKDLDGAEASAKEALNPEQKQKVSRAEFVLGRISEARGDIESARQHIAKYIELEPNAADIQQIKAFLQAIGKPEAAGMDPELELP